MSRCGSMGAPASGVLGVAQADAHRHRGAGGFILGGPHPPSWGSGALAKIPRGQRLPSLVRGP